MATIYNYIGQRLICFAHYFPNGSLRLFPQCVIDNGRLETIERKEKERVFAPEGAIFFPSREKIKQCGSVVEVKFRGIPPVNQQNGAKCDKYLGQSAFTDIRAFEFHDALICLKCTNYSIHELKIKKYIAWKVSLLPAKGNNIYVKCADGIVGPLSYEICGENMYVNALKENDYHVNLYSALVKNEVDFYANDSFVMMLIPPSSLNAEDVVESVDFLGEKEARETLIKMLSEYKFIDGIQGFECDKILRIIKDSDLVKPYPERIKVFRNILNEIYEYDNLLKNLVDYVVSQESIVNRIKTVTTFNPKNYQLASPNVSLYQSLNRNNQVLQVSNRELLRDIRNLNGENERIKNENAELRNRISALSIEKSKNELAFERDETKRLLVDQNSFNRFDKTTENGTEYAKKLNELKRIESEVLQTIEDKINALQEKIDAYKTAAGGLAEQVNQELLTKIRNIISSVHVQDSKQEERETLNDDGENMVESMAVPILPLTRYSADLQDARLGKEIIGRVQGYLAAKNRFCSAVEVANYLVCLTQGFMTTFAGNPGSGKTSLCNLLAKALGLVAAHDGTHFVDVPVSRGWTSAKDFIGYYNPLAKQMVRSNAAVYKALELSEQEDCKEVPPMVILLDEANLSPLEHYWSSFLKNSDFSSSTARSFSLGGDKVWKINPHLRFLATVNHDHTTEELSPRFLDRSWVILLDGQSSEVDARDINIPDISGEWAAIPYAKLEEAFGVAAHAKLTMKPEVQQLWTSIRDIMQKSQMSIMPRNVNMVENYIKTASLYMSDAFAPLDYAMAQKILPTLSGSGERMKDCLTQLHRLCDGKLLRTAALLARMLDAGKHNMEMYQFFVS